MRFQISSKRRPDTGNSAIHGDSDDESSLLFVRVHSPSLPLWICDRPFFLLGGGCLGWVKDG